MPRIKLPQPSFDSKTSLEQALLKRKSIREYHNQLLTLTQVSQLLWSAYGIISSDGRRTAPSAGAIYPLILYLAVGNVENLPQGIYKYLPTTHTLTFVLAGDKRIEIAQAAYQQMWIKDSSIILLYCANFDAIVSRYQEAGKIYTYFEVGHSAQNVSLQVVSLGLATVCVVAFFPQKIKEIFNLPTNEHPLYIMPIGK
jgi:SagB-type dehydrogenase family enzyme